MKPIDDKLPNEDDLRIAAQAARWQQTLDGADEATREAFCAWVKISPRHLQEFLFMEALDAASGKIDPHRQIAIDTSPAVVSANLVQLRERPALPATQVPRISRRRWRVPFAAAASLAVLAIIIASFVRTSGDWQQYATAVGEQRAVELEDGSVIQLNTQSRVEAQLTEHGREIRLLEGEALFKVAHDPLRPFRVHAGDAVIRAVGTQFNVSHRTTSTTVAVLEGRVQVEKHASPQIFDAGEGARIVPDGKVIREKLNVAEVATWRQRRLIFREETLENIAAEFNRYNRSPQIFVEGETARAERYGGTFDADDPESLAQFVTAKGRFAVAQDAARIVIRSN